MYHVVLQSGEYDSYAQPTISDVENGERQIWQADGEGTPALIKSYLMTDILATVDCIHEEVLCEDLQGVLDRLPKPDPEPIEARVQRKFAAFKEAQAQKEKEKDNGDRLRQEREQLIGNRAAAKPDALPD
jgi:hypothetical protein